MGPEIAGQIEQNFNDDLLNHITEEESSVRFTPVDCNYVRKAIQQLKTDRAPGLDKIPIMLIKGATERIS